MWKLYHFLLGKIPELSIKNVRCAKWVDAFVLLLLVFQPYLIQYAHFGTTETMLMLLYVLTVYYSLRFIDRPSWRWVAASALVVGISAATKTSALIYLAVPFVTILYVLIRGSAFPTVKRKIYAAIRYFLTFCLVTFLVYVIASPHKDVYKRQVQFRQ